MARRPGLGGSLSLSFCCGRWQSSSFILRGKLRAGLRGSRIHTVFNTNSVRVWRPRQKRPFIFHVAKVTGGLEHVFQREFGGLLSLTDSLSQLSSLEDHLGWSAGGGFYSNCIPGSSRNTSMSYDQSRFESLQPCGAVGTCDTL